VLKILTMVVISSICGKTQLYTVISFVIQILLQGDFASSYFLLIYLYCTYGRPQEKNNKMLSYRKETALQGAL